MTSIITKALVLKKSSNGNKISRKYEIIHDYQCPSLEEDDILIEVKACSLTEDEESQVWGRQQASADEVIPVGKEISGKVTEAGKAVSRFKIGDEVVGIIPPDVTCSGCAKFCVLSQYDVVLKPEDVNHQNAVSILKDAVKAYTALHYLAKVSNGDTILLCNCASGFGLAVIQLAQSIGAKVIASENNDEGLNFLRRHKKADCVVIDTRLKKRSLVDVCFEETGGLGVDCIIDNGVEMYANSVDDSHDDLISFDDSLASKPHKHDIISSLAVGGRWITTQSDLQLDPPDSQLLFLKCSSLHFLFEDCWTLSKSAHGKYLHILVDIMNKLSKGVLRPMDYHTIQMEECPKALEVTDSSKIKKTIINIT